jgi:hypothetical protein
MKQISPQASAALEAARHDDGKFGPQSHDESGEVPVAPVYDRIKFSFDAVPDQTFPALSYGGLWNGWEAPVVDKDTLQRVLTVSEEPFTWDGDTAVIENNGGDLERFGPSEDGTYNLGELGWCFVRVLPDDDDDAVCDRCDEPLTFEQATDGYCPTCDGE